jgi:hypothetical protein
MSFNKKEYTKKVKKSCTVLSYNKSSNKKCNNILLQCHLNKCLPYIESTENSNITEAEKEDCDKKYGNDYKNKNKCVEKILEKKGFNEANAKKGHCIANKCPEVSEFVAESMKKSLNKIKNHSKDECIKKHCNKELTAKEKVSFFNNIDKCNKESDDYKKQKKCSEKRTKAFFKLHDKLRKCTIKNCDNKNNTNTKKTNTKKTNTKK